ncbi:MAG: hypothetical protein JSU69_09850, partial [Candidatus Zixiibacteriota bacterium]
DDLEAKSDQSAIAAQAGTLKSSGEQVKWQVISSGGTNAGSANYRLKGTVGQTAVGMGMSDSYRLRSGFWQDFAAGGVCDCIPGDADGDGKHLILDVTHIINYLYKDGPDPIPYATCSGDADCDCKVLILDVTYLINYLYKNGPAPGSCEDWVTECGPPAK